MSEGLFTVCIPYVITIQGKKWDVSKPLKEYLNGSVVQELSRTNMVAIENEGIVWNANSMDTNELLIKVSSVDPRDVLYYGHIEAKENEAVYTAVTKNTPYDIDLETVKFTLPIVDREIPSIFHPESSDAAIQDELNHRKFLIVHITAGVIYPNDISK